MADVSVSSEVGKPTSVAVAATSTLVLAGNPGRTGVAICNAGAVTAYISFGFTPTTTLYSVALAAGSYYEVPFGFLSAIYGITASGTATVLVTEFV